MANKQVILDTTGNIVAIENTSIDVTNYLLKGFRVVIVPESVVVANKSLGQDPRSEFHVIMQKQFMGTGCTAGGITSGMTGCGQYDWNEKVQQNVTLVETTSQENSVPTYNTTTKKFGQSSAQFHGVNGTTGGILIIPNDCPGLTLAGTGGWSGDTLIQTFFYIDATPTANQVLVAQGTTSGGGTGNSFKLYIDSSGPTLKFDFNNTGDPGNAWAHSLTVAPSTGLTNGQWHHVAILYRSRWGGSNASVVHPYFNGASGDGIATSVVNDLLNSEEPISVGGLRDGAFAFKGKLDDLHIQTGPSGGTVQAGYTGPTYTVPALGATLDEQSSVVLMKFDGVTGCSKFTMDSNDKIKARVVSWEEHKLGVRNQEVSGEVMYGQSGGFNYTGSKYYGYVQGLSSGAVYAVSCTGGTLMPCDDKKRIVKAQMSVAYNEYKSLRGISGNSGASGDLPELFGPHSGLGHGSPRFHGNHANGFSVYLTDKVFRDLTEHVQYINCLGGSNGSGGNFTLQNTLGQAVGFSAGHVLALYQDVWTFRQNLVEDKNLRMQEINDDTCSDASPILAFHTITGRKLTAGGIGDGQFDGFDVEGSGQYTTTTQNQQGFGNTISEESAGIFVTAFTSFSMESGKG
jgi:hypothetical protein